MDDLNKLLSLPLFNIGGTLTTLGSLLSVIVVIVATVLIARLADKAVYRSLERLNKDEAKTSRSYSIIITLFIWFIGFEIALHMLGIHLTSLFAASGFIALGAGFAVKTIVENFFSGIILRLEKTIRSGDLIVVNDEWMYVHHIGMRITTALTYDGEQVLIPNSQIAQSMVTNLTRNDRLHRIQVQLGVSYDSDLKLVSETLRQTVDKLEWRSKKRPPSLYLDEFGGSSVNYSVDVWIDDANDSRGRRSEMHEAIWWALKDKGITLAFPQMDVHLDQKFT